MENRASCKSCDPALRMTAEEIAKVFHGLAVRKVKLADRAEYERRLRICGNCPDLRGGTTCGHCGCLVEVRAKIAASSCPAPGSSFWA